MDDHTVFNLYFPNSVFINGIDNVYNLTIDEYAAGRYLSFFSGSYISDVSGSSLEDVGISSRYSSDSALFALTFNNSAYLGTGADVSYTTIIYDFYSGAIIGDYSASSIGEISVLTIKDFTERPV